MFSWVKIEFWLIIWAICGFLIFIRSKFDLNKHKQWILLLINAGLVAGFLSENIRVLYLITIFLLISYALLRALQAIRDSKLPGFATGSLMYISIIFLVLALAITKYQVLLEFRPFRVLYIDLREFIHHPRGRFAIIGISYLVFRLIHLAIEIGQGAVRQLRFLSFLNFCFFFPVYLSGPLTRYPDFERDLNESLFELNRFQMSAGVFRIFTGLFKKLVISSIFSDFALNSLRLTRLDSISPELALQTLSCDFMALYFDFSGYSDMAIGLGLLLGIKVPENFNFPLGAKNIREFWNRWHISLSMWIRDYIFYPTMKLGLQISGGAGALTISAFAIFLAFVLCGVWHGDGLAFLVWGAVYGIALAVYMLYSAALKKALGPKRLRALKANTVYGIFGWGLTFTLVIINQSLFTLSWEEAKIFWSLVLKPYGITL